MRQPKGFLKINNTDATYLIDIPVTSKDCVRCSKIEETNKISQHLINFVCNYCRLDSLELGHEMVEEVSSKDNDVK